MRKLFAILLALTLMLSLVACGDTANTPADGTEPETTDAADTTTEATTTEATTTTEETTTEATTTEPEPEPEPEPEYIEALFNKVDISAENLNSVQLVNEDVAIEDYLTFNEDGSITGNGLTLFAFNLPENLPMDTTVLVHIKGSADDNFRSWLLDSGLVTSSNQVNMLNDFNFFKAGEFEFMYELTVQYIDNTIADDTACQIAFKAPSYDSTITNLTLTDVSIYNGTYEEYKEAALNYVPGEEVPAEGEEAPAEGEEAPAEGEEAPAEGEEAPADDAAEDTDIPVEDEE